MFKNKSDRYSAIIAILVVVAGVFLYGYFSTHKIIDLRNCQHVEIPETSDYYTCFKDGANE